MTQPPYPSSGSDSGSDSASSSGTPGWYGSSEPQNPYESVPPSSAQDAGAQPSYGAGPPESFQTQGQYGQQEQYAPGQYGQYGQYGPGQYGPGQYGPGQYAVSPEGQSNATTSLVLAIIGLFAFGIILGPLAIFFASKAERAGVPATAGKVIGWIVTILWALGVLFFIFIFVGVLLAGSTASSGY